MILISTHSEQDYAEMIADSSALGFLAKFALSPAAIMGMLGQQALTRLVRSTTLGLAAGLPLPPRRHFHGRTTAVRDRTWRRV